MYTIGSEALCERPEIRFGDKVYGVDNRLRTFEKIGDELKDGRNAFRSVITNALGQDAYDEIIVQDPPMPALQKLIVAIMAAMQGITEEEAARSFREAREE